MKKTSLLTVMVFLIVACAYSQGNSIPQLAKSNQFYFKPESGDVIELEAQEVVIQTKMKAAGFGGSSTAYVMEGAASPVIINHQQPTFLIKINSTMYSMMENVEHMFRLHKFEKKGETRTSILSKVGIMGTGAKQEGEGIPISTIKGENNTILVTPGKPLKPGEYAIVLMMSPGSSTGKGGANSQSYQACAFAIVE